MTPTSDQWKSGGDCTKCRRAVPKVYCRKPCKEAIRMKKQALRLLKAMEKAQMGMRQIQTGGVTDGGQVPVDPPAVLGGGLAGTDEVGQTD